MLFGSARARSANKAGGQLPGRCRRWAFYCSRRVVTRCNSAATAKTTCSSSPPTPGSSRRTTSASAACGPPRPPGRDPAWPGQLAE